MCMKVTIDRTVSSATDTQEGPIATATVELGIELKHDNISSKINIRIGFAAIT